MKITTVGGYEEVGRNMTAVEASGDTLIIDMGIRLDRVMIHEDTDTSKMSQKELIEKGIVPDISKVKGDVKAIILGHGHLDHIGAVAHLAKNYKKAPIIGTPYTIELIKHERRYAKIPNKLVVLEQGDTMDISNKTSIEFVRMTHSIPHSTMCVAHTNEGTLVYANDFKLDDTPVIGKKPDYDRLKQIGKDGVDVLIVESVNVSSEGRTPSEEIAKKLTEDILLKSDPDKGVVITTFSSQIARIHAITEMASSMGVTPLLLGRSMQKYTSIAEHLGLLDLPEGTQVYGDQKSIKKALIRAVNDGKEKYLPLVTGHQGEPDALLSKITAGKVPYKIEKDDQVVFSSGVIPNPINEANRYALETKLHMLGARIYKDAHVSGHASKEDHRDVLKMLKPANIVPCHGNLTMLSTYAELAEELGYSIDKDMYLRRNGQKIEL
jgi:ribonuclease J